MKKYWTFFILMIVCFGFFSQMVFAGDEDNPEVEDPEGDVVFALGMFSGTLINRFCKNLDILKVWFFENPDDPDYLFATLKLREYKISFLMVAYGILWYHEDIEYGAIVFFSRGDEYMSGVQIQESEYVPVDDFYIINEVENTITFKIPKDIVGELEPGDIIDDPFVVAASRFVSDALSDLMDRITGGNVLFVDFAMSGRDYTIQY